MKQKGPGRVLPQPELKTQRKASVKKNQRQVRADRSPESPQNQSSSARDPILERVFAGGCEGTAAWVTNFLDNASARDVFLQFFRSLPDDQLRQLAQRLIDVRSWNVSERARQAQELFEEDRIECLEDSINQLCAFALLVVDRLTLQAKTASEGYVAEISALRSVLSNNAECCFEELEKSYRKLGHALQIEAAKVDMLAAHFGTDAGSTSHLQPGGES
ncbi:MAG TPA: hypothetical protein GYA07_05055 [Verrucomicrobia bacterium]|nr:hypothetical protein [Verrucomicrobiota bacterium]HOQ47879.1 hypothetical protein [Bryobacteraceae bacterium]